MKGFVKTDKQSQTGSYQTVSTPEVGQGDVLVEVHVAGICGTDMHVYQAAPFMMGKVNPPVTMGHEATGTIIEIGSAVTHLKTGDRIAVESHIWCGHCPVCDAGFEHVCPNTHYFGVDRNGVFADNVVLPARVCRKVPSTISDTDAALLEPFGVAVHATTIGGGVAGATVLIAGCGPIGLMNIAAAKALGAAHIYAVDINPLRLEAAKELGADQTISVKEAPLSKQLGQTTANLINVAIDYTGDEQVINHLAHILQPGGTLRLLAIPQTTSHFPYEHIVLKGIEVYGIHGRKLFETWQIAEKLLIEKKVNLKPVISHRLSLRDAAEGFNLIMQGEALKVLLSPERKAS